MKKKYLYMIIGVIIAFMVYHVSHEFRIFRLYSSPKVVMNMMDWWLHIDRFYKNYFTVPTIEEFFYYCSNDTFVKENFPNVIPERLKKEDFVITKDSSGYFSVWLFSELRKGKDTIFYSEMSFIDFLFKRSILLTSAPLSDPCGSKNFIILKDKQRIEDQFLENKLRRIINDISLEMKKKSEIDSMIHCIHVYFENKQLRVELVPIDKDHRWTDSLRNKIISNFRFFEKDHSQYEFYFRIEN